MALAGMLVVATGLVAGASPPSVGGGSLLTVCRAHQDGLKGLGSPTCRTAEAVLRSNAAACRLAVAPLADQRVCALIDGIPVSPAQVTAYENSWTHRALGLQRGLDDAAPLLDELFLHTHNSFNAAAYTLPKGLAPPTYYPTLTNQDPNQLYSMADQLRLDVRAIEIDLHWFPSPYGSLATAGNWVTICHGQTNAVGPVNVQIGCSIDKPVQVGFAEVADWMAKNPDQFVILYLENQLQSNVMAHTIAGDQVKKYFGSYLVPTPAGQPCAPMPYETSRASLLAKGQRLLIVGNCDVGARTSWGQVVHERGPLWDESGDPSHYAATDCAKDQAAHLARTSFRRYYQDATWLSEVTSINPTKTSTMRTLSPANITKEVSCGVNLAGMDNLRPDDGRIAAVVWSWAVNEPAVAGCAEHGADGRFRSIACNQQRAFTCLSPSGDWHVTVAAGPWTAGATTCASEFPGSRFSVPANGFANQRLISAKSVAGVRHAWLAYHQVGTGWQLA